MTRITQESPKHLFIPPKQKASPYNTNNPSWSEYPWKSPCPTVTPLNHNEKVQLPKPAGFSSKHSNSHLPEGDATNTYTSKEAFLALGNTTQSIANKVHEIWEHNQHLWKAGPDQCTPAFEGMPEAPHPFRDFCTFFINITSVKLGWTSAGQSPAQTPHTASCFHAVFLSRPLPLGSRSPVLLSKHKLLPNLNPTEEIWLQRQQSHPSCMMLTRCLCSFDTCSACCGYTSLM